MSESAQLVPGSDEDRPEVDIHISSPVIAENNNQPSVNNQLLEPTIESHDQNKPDSVSNLSNEPKLDEKDNEELSENDFEKPVLKEFNEEEFSSSVTIEINEPANITIRKTEEETDEAAPEEDSQKIRDKIDKNIFKEQNSNNVDILTNNSTKIDTQDSQDDDNNDNEAEKPENADNIYGDDQNIEEEENYNVDNNKYDDVIDADDVEDELEDVEVVNNFVKSDEEIIRNSTEYFRLINGDNCEGVEIHLGQRYIENDETSSPKLTDKPVLTFTYDPLWYEHGITRMTPPYYADFINDCEQNIIQNYGTNEDGTLYHFNAEENQAITDSTIEGITTTFVNSLDAMVTRVETFIMTIAGLVPGSNVEPMMDFLAEKIDNASKEYDDILAKMVDTLYTVDDVNLRPFTNFYDPRAYEYVIALRIEMQRILMSVEMFLVKNIIIPTLTAALQTYYRVCNSHIDQQTIGSKSTLSVISETVAKSNFNPLIGPNHQRQSLQVVTDSTQQFLRVCERLISASEELSENTKETIAQQSVFLQTLRDIARDTLQEEDDRVNSMINTIIPYSSKLISDRTRILKRYEHVYEITNSYINTVLKDIRKIDEQITMLMDNNVISKLSAINETNNPNPNASANNTTNAAAISNINHTIDFAPGAAVELFTSRRAQKRKEKYSSPMILPDKEVLPNYLKQTTATTLGASSLKKTNISPLPENSMKLAADVFSQVEDNTQKTNEASKECGTVVIHTNNGDIELMSLKQTIEYIMEIWKMKKKLDDSAIKLAYEKKKEVIENNLNISKVDIRQIGKACERNLGISLCDCSVSSSMAILDSQQSLNINIPFFETQTERVKKPGEECRYSCPAVKTPREAVSSFFNTKFGVGTGSRSSIICKKFMLSLVHHANITKNSICKLLVSEMKGEIDESLKDDLNIFEKNASAQISAYMTCLLDLENKGEYIEAISLSGKPILKPKKYLLQRDLEYIINKRRNVVGVSVEQIRELFEKPYPVNSFANNFCNSRITVSDSIVTTAPSCVTESSLSTLNGYINQSTNSDIQNETQNKPQPISGTTLTSTEFFILKAAIKDVDEFIKYLIRSSEVIDYEWIGSTEEDIECLSKNPSTLLKISWNDVVEKLQLYQIDRHIVFLKHFRDYFAKLDITHEGKLSRKEFIELVVQVGLPVMENTIHDKEYENTVQKIEAEGYQTDPRKQKVLNQKIKMAKIRRNRELVQKCCDSVPTFDSDIITFSQAVEVLVQCIEVLNKTVEKSMTRVASFAQPTGDDENFYTRDTDRNTELNGSTSKEIDYKKPDEKMCINDLQ